MSNIVYVVCEAGWETFEIEGLYATKESAERSMHHWVLEKNKETHALYGKDSEDYNDFPEIYDKNLKDWTYNYDPEMQEWKNCMDHIFIKEFILNP